MSDFDGLSQFNWSPRDPATGHTINVPKITELNNSLRKNDENRADLKERTDKTETNNVMTGLCNTASVKKTPFILNRRNGKAEETIVEVISRMGSRRAG